MTGIVKQMEMAIGCDSLHYIPMDSSFPAVRQIPNHCFVACLVTFLTTSTSAQDHIKMQSDIVSKFPSELQKGTAQEGVPENLYKLGEVIEQLGISDDVQAGHEWPGVKDEILAQKDVVNQNANLLLGTVWPSKHCLRVRKVTADGVEVMDPATGTDRPLTWAECEQHKMTCIFL